MEFVDEENLNNGFGQHLLRVHWRPWVHQSQLPTVQKIFCISNSDTREQDEMVTNLSNDFCV